MDCQLRPAALGVDVDRGEHGTIADRPTLPFLLVASHMPEKKPPLLRACGQRD